MPVHLTVDRPGSAGLGNRLPNALPSIIYGTQLRPSWSPQLERHRDTTGTRWAQLDGFCWHVDAAGRFRGETDVRPGTVAGVVVSVGHPGRACTFGGPVIGGSPRPAGSAPSTQGRPAHHHRRRRRRRRRALPGAFPDRAGELTSQPLDDEFTTGLRDRRLCLHQKDFAGTGSVRCGQDPVHR
jgi:hypothetical protein